MASLTDLALGLVTVYLVAWLPRAVEGARFWRAAFAWAAVTALVGAVYHGILVGLPRAGEVTWAVMSTMVVVVMSYLLAASVVQVLGRRRAVVFWPLRLLGFAAYAVIAATGHSSVTAIMWCESLTMACVIGLWVWAWLRRHPAGRSMLVAIGVSIAAGLLRLVPGAAAALRLDPDSAYHIGQIVGMALLFRAVARRGPRPEPVYDAPPAGPGGGGDPGPTRPPDPRPWNPLRPVDPATARNAAALSRPRGRIHPISGHRTAKRSPTPRSRTIRARDTSPGEAHPHLRRSTRQHNL